MIQIAAQNQSDPGLVDRHVSNSLSQLSSGASEPDKTISTVAFVGYSAWRREENHDVNLFDEQVFVVRDGRVRFLEPRYELEKCSPDGFSLEMGRNAILIYGVRGNSSPVGKSGSLT